jgi:NIPSNAP
MTSELRHQREKREMAFYELRQYKVRPGKIDEWVKIMEEEIIPFQVSKGMVICGSFRGETDESVYVWLRRFESEAEREALYKAVYESDHWKTKIAPRVPDYLDRSGIVVTRIVPTPKSVMP